MCLRKSGDGEETHAPWLARVRPWWSHHDHFHVRLKCPGDSPLCQSQDPLPADAGCGAALAWWFSDDAQATVAPFWSSITCA